MYRSDINKFVINTIAASSPYNALKFVFSLVCNINYADEIVIKFVIVSERKRTIEDED